MAAHRRGDRGDRGEGPAPANPAAAPGSSGPGEHGYGGAATIGDEGAAAGPEAYADPFGRPEPEYRPGETELGDGPADAAPPRTDPEEKR